MMSVSSLPYWMDLSFNLPKKRTNSYTRIRDIAESPLKSRSGRGVTLLGLHKRNAAGVALPRTDAGLLKEHTRGSTDSENCWSDMRSWLRAMKPLSVLPRQLSVGGRLVLFTDKSLITVCPLPWPVYVAHGRILWENTSTPLP